MAFINVGGNNVTSFAAYEDVLKIDQRLFEANEFQLVEASTLADEVEIILTRATGRLLSIIGTTDWWRNYYMRLTNGTLNLVSLGLLAIPNPDPNKIQARQADFTDLCVYYALSYYIYPRVADFSKEDNAERAKIGFFNEKYRSLLQELIDDGSWYDWSGDGTITNNEKLPVRTNVIRVR
jgi:hypothetical protein